MQVSPESERAVAIVTEYIATHGLDVGELIGCTRVGFGPDVRDRLMKDAPEHLRGRVGEIFSRVPERQRQAHWQLWFKKPAQAEAEEPFLVARFNVFDDGVVEFVGQH